MIDPLVAMSAACISMKAEGLGEIELDFEECNEEGAMRSLKITIRKDSIYEYDKHSQ